jgi:hypothetical protein
MEFLTSYIYEKIYNKLSMTISNFKHNNILLEIEFWKLYTRFRNIKVQRYQQNLSTAWWDNENIHPIT